jgi:outer membrane lipoprotein carrier protein
MKRFLLLLCVVFSAHATPASDLNGLLTSMASLRANYVQTTTDPKFYDQKVVSGKALLSRPNQFRWEIEKPYQQLLVADGNKLWIYDADLEQATVQPLKDNLKDTPALLLAGDPRAVTDHFKVSMKDTGFGEITYALTPTDEDSLVRSVQLTFKGSVISRMTLVDNLHQIVTIEFSQIKVNEKLPQDFFRFTPPQGVDVISND